MQGFHQTVVIFFAQNDGITVLSCDVDGFIEPDCLLKQIENVFSKMSYIDVQHSINPPYVHYSVHCGVCQEECTILRTSFSQNLLKIYAKCGTILLAEDLHKNSLIINSH